MPLFDDLRNPETKLPNGAPLPPLFDFKPQELFEHPPSTKSKLVPEWVKEKQQQQGGQ